MMRLSNFQTFFEVVRDGEFDTLGNVTSHPDSSFLTYCINILFLHRACANPKISCIICSRDMVEDDVLCRSGKGIAVAKNPQYTFYSLHNSLSDASNGCFYAPQFEETTIGNGCTIHDRAIIADKGVTIGNNVTIEANAIIKEGSIIRDNCIIHAGAIIGYSSCLVAKDLNENQFPIASIGTVQLENNVEVGSYSLISKGVFPYEESRIGAYSQIGASVIVSHNHHIGKNSIILDQSQICGNVSAENQLHVAPHAIVSNRLYLSEQANVALGAVVVQNVKSGEKVAGNFAIEMSKFLLWHRKKLSGK